MKQLKIKKILVPVDFSRASARTLHFATRLASSFESRLYVLHVIYDPPDRPGFYSAEQSEDQRVQSIHSAATAMLKKFLKKANIKKKHIHRIILEPGVPHKRIVEIATLKKVDLIIMASQAGTLKRFFLGSVAEKVLRRAPCRVLMNHESAVRKRGKNGESSGNNDTGKPEGSL